MTETNPHHLPATTAPLDAVAQRDERSLKLPPMLMVCQARGVPFAGHKAVVDIVDDFALPERDDRLPDLRNVLC